MLIRVLVIKSIKGWDRLNNVGLNFILSYCDVWQLQRHEDGACVFEGNIMVPQQQWL
jgi:hypothetical protein